MNPNSPQDGYVQVAPDSTGKKVDNAEFIREPVNPGDATVTVERQRIILGSDENPRLQAKLGGEAGDGYVLVDAKAFNEMIEKMDEMIDLMRLIHDL